MEVNTKLIKVNVQDTTEIDIQPIPNSNNGYKNLPAISQRQQQVRKM